MDTACVMSIFDMMWVLYEMACVVCMWSLVGSLVIGNSIVLHIDEVSLCWAQLVILIIMDVRFTSIPSWFINQLGPTHANSAKLSISQFWLNVGPVDGTTGILIYLIKGIFNWGCMTDVGCMLA